MTNGENIDQEVKVEGNTSAQGYKAYVAVALAVLLIVGAYIIFNNDGVIDTATISESNKAAVLQAVSSPDLGEYLVDENGRTLYIRDRECTGSCLESWPPYLYTGEGALGELGLITRNEVDNPQYTYNGDALYYYSGDSVAGDVNGHGQNGWSVVRPN